MTWPTGSGQNFKGTYDLNNNRMLVFDNTDRSRIGEVIENYQIADPNFAEEVELVRAGYPAFDLESYRAGHLSPVFFGSAYNNFGVKELLDAIAAWAPPPRPQPAEPRPIEPTEPKVSGFVFKVQANMDPNHRDRIAFLRLCSGKFRRGMKLTQMGTSKVAVGQLADPVLRPRARDRRRGVARRHHRHSQPRRAAGRRHADRGRGRSRSSAFPTSRRKSCAACGWKTR